MHVMFVLRGSHTWPALHTEMCCYFQCLCCWRRVHRATKICFSCLWGAYTCMHKRSTHAYTHACTVVWRFCNKFCTGMSKPLDGKAMPQTGTTVNTYVCMCVCMYVRGWEGYVAKWNHSEYICMHACMHVCMYVCMYVCTSADGKVMP